MLAALFAISLALSGTADAGAWRESVVEFASEHAQHTAWGVQHSERNYRLAKQLAEEEGLAVDDDVLFAAAYLHDLGAIDGFRKEGVDHSVRSVELLAEHLPKDFPAEKIDRVKAAIMGHMFNADPGDVFEAIVLHDADTLDFMGAIGVMRIVSLSTRHPWAKDNATAVATLRRFETQLPPALKTDAAKKMGAVRLAEMKRVLDEIEAEARGSL